MIAIPKLIPAPVWSELSLSIARGETPQVQRLVEQHSLDVNAFVDSGSWMPLLMEAMLSYGFATEDERLPLLKYLLDKGADPNIRCLRGYNCVHIAVQQEKYSKALDLFLDYHADVNIGDEDGSNIVYWAIQGWLLRKDTVNDASNDAASPGSEDHPASPGSEDRAAHLHILEKILALGANLDQDNRFGMCARLWLEGAAPDVKATVARWEQANPVIQPSTTTQPVFPVNLHYPEIAMKIWTELVPKTGIANTVHGELMQAVERLREDAQRNGISRNRRQQKRTARFIRDTLIDSKLFDAAGIERIRSTTGRLIKGSRLYPSDDIYDQLVDQVCIYYKEKPPRQARTFAPERL
ncbi:MAG TPA: ankyrin repeat domain-containing protein [Puia sp.]|nr:ankyrin repeat domain-containing protein [Puia sp.]